MPRKSAVYTIGHSTHPLKEFIAILHEAQVDFVVDVRTIPRSRTNPQFNHDAIALPLSKAGIGYRHIATLGGLRARQKALPESLNTWWTNKSFQNYADYALSESFREGLAELEALTTTHTCAVMCAEAVWWRCHRRIIADYLLAAKYQVFHIMGAGKIEPAHLTEAAAIVGEKEIRYCA